MPSDPPRSPFWNDRALMLDLPVRRRLAPALDAAAANLGRRGVRPAWVTACGLVIGIAACTAAALGAWTAALVLWLTNRLLDGLDGPLARRGRPAAIGGLLDFSADFVVYSGFIVAVAIAEPQARLACVVLLATYIVNNVVLLSFSSIVERLGLELGDERSLQLTVGLAEGTETILVYTLFCVFPGSSEAIAWAFAVLVAATAIQRFIHAERALRGR